MSVSSAPFYWLTCDADGCDMSTADLSDHAAWSEVDGAEDTARDWGWYVSEGKHLCEKHSDGLLCECGDPKAFSADTCGHPLCKPSQERPS